MLDEVGAVTGYHRNYGIRLLGSACSTVDGSSRIDKNRRGYSASGAPAEATERAPLKRAGSNRDRSSVGLPSSNHSAT